MLILSTVSINQSDPLILFEGMSLQLDCLTTGAVSPNIIWSPQGTTFDLTNSRLHIMGNSLIIDDVMQNDTGRYFCSSKLSARVIHTSIYVAVITMETIPTTTAQSGELPHLHPLTLHPSPLTPHFSPFTHHTSPLSSPITVHPSLPPSPFTLHSSPLTPHSALTNLKHVGDTVILDCYAKNLPPSVTSRWFFNGTSINFSGRYMKAKMGKLIISKLETGDTGKYVCELREGMRLFQKLEVQGLQGKGKGG